MILPPNLERRILGKHIAWLGELPLTAEYSSGHDQCLRPRPALHEPAANQQLICADLGYARAPSMPALLTRSAFRTVSTICGAFSPASSYCFSGFS